MQMLHLNETIDPMDRALTKEDQHILITIEHLPKHIYI